MDAEGKYHRSDGDPEDPLQCGVESQVVKPVETKDADGLHDKHARRRNELNAAKEGPKDVPVILGQPNFESLEPTTGRGGSGVPPASARNYGIHLRILVIAPVGHCNRPILRLGCPVLSPVRRRRPDTLRATSLGHRAEELRRVTCGRRLEEHLLSGRSYRRRFARSADTHWGWVSVN
jgi:hypothetical protein